MNVFSTNFLMAVVGSLLAPSTWLLGRYFSAIQTETSEEIHFDVIDKTRRLAPFVSPVVAGKVVQSQGHTTKTFQPAYVKPKTPFDPNRPFKRAVGEQIGGTLTPEQRLQLQVTAEIIEHREMIDRRMEVMASEALRTGKITVTGDNYPTVVVDFGRHPDLTVVLGGGAQWGDAGVSPLGLLNQWALLMLQRSGAKPIDIVMDIDAFTLFAADAEVKERLDTRRITNNAMIMGGPMDIGGTFMGTIDGFNVWSYADWYIDPADETEKPVLPSRTVLASGPQLQGVRAFGAIRDEEAGFQAVPFFAKSWVEKDPSVRYLLTQSAPLPVPTRVNASFCATV